MEERWKNGIETLLLATTTFVALIVVNDAARMLAPIQVSPALLVSYLDGFALFVVVFKAARSIQGLKKETRSVTVEQPGDARDL